jgi:uncharacterized protein YaiI (UPF0178 family)
LALSAFVSRLAPFRRSAYTASGSGADESCSNAVLQIELVFQSERTNPVTDTPCLPLPAPKSITVFIDADACPVKDETYKVAARHGLKTYVVANSWINVPREAEIHRIVVEAGPDVADNWIAERAGPGSIVITADIPLAARCVKVGAAVIAPSGKAFAEQSIGMALATRNLMDELRSAGEITGGPRPFSQRDRSSFLSALDLAIVRLKRAGFVAAT